MDPAPFLGPRRHSRVEAREWGAATAKTMLGAVLLWGVARRMAHPLAAGWTGMVGLIFLLHFGGIHLLALAWRTLGVPVKTLMHNPAAAATLNEFWGSRWNRGFSDLARREVFRPLAPVLGTGGATMAVFLFSGYVHELAISVPAGGCHGWPTAYFLGQGAAGLWQRAHPRYASGRRGRLFTLGIVAGPAFWLFPPLFVERVILPFLQVLHAL
jgi:D-alanyl-lipoteichoic acid acyltransferase DltB (MBOAT superfamily)